MIFFVDYQRYSPHVGEVSAPWSHVLLLSLRQLAYPVGFPFFLSGLRPDFLSHLLCAFPPGFPPDCFLRTRLWIFDCLSVFYVVQREALCLHVMNKSYPPPSYPPFPDPPPTPPPPRGLPRPDNRKISPTLGCGSTPAGSAAITGAAEKLLSRVTRRGRWPAPTWS